MEMSKTLILGWKNKEGVFLLDLPPSTRVKDIIEKNLLFPYKKKR